VAGIAGIVATFSVNYYMFAAFRFLIAMSLVGGLVIVSVVREFYVISVLFH